MNSFLLVALGGALGSMARHGVNLLAKHFGFIDFPAGTLIVNVIGSLLIGVMAGYLANTTQWSDEIRGFAVVGILGGFTTFSAFSLDIVTLYERGNYSVMGVYLGLSLFLSIAALLFGLYAMRSAYS